MYIQSMDNPWLGFLCSYNVLILLILSLKEAKEFQNQCQVFLCDGTREAVLIFNDACSLFFWSARMQRNTECGQTSVHLYGTVLLEIQKEASVLLVAGHEVLIS